MTTEGQETDGADINFSTQTFTDHARIDRVYLHGTRAAPSRGSISFVIRHGSTSARKRAPLETARPVHGTPLPLATDTRARPVSCTLQRERNAASVLPLRDNKNPAIFTRHRISHRWPCVEDGVDKIRGSRDKAEREEKYEKYQSPARCSRQLDQHWIRTAMHIRRLSGWSLLISVRWNERRTTSR